MNEVFSDGGVFISYRFMKLAICLLIFFMEFAPVCDAFDGIAIVAARSKSVGGLGHVGVAILNSNGTWTAGAIEGINSQPVINSGDNNGAWIKWDLKSEAEVINEFASKTDYHDAYDKIKTIPVINANQESAGKAIKRMRITGYSVPFNDCLTGVDAVLKAYGAIDLPLLSIILSGQNYAPNVYFKLLPGTIKSLSPASANQLDSHLSWLDSDFKNDLGGVNFTSISINYISVTKDDEGGANFDYVLKARKAEGDRPGLDIFNSTLLSTTAFVTGLSLTNDKFWVNLNPWEPNRVIDEQLARTDVGRIMLEADLQMKKDFCNYANPCTNETGKALWSLLEKKQKTLVQMCMEKFPGEIKDIINVRFGAATRYWIIPDEVNILTNGTEIYITNSTLNIRSESLVEHSLFVLDNQDNNSLSKGCLDELNSSAKEFSRYSREIQDRMILPFVVADVNHDEKYEDLRNVYNSLALAESYKGKIAPEIDVFQGNLHTSMNSTGLDALVSWNPKEIWEKYVYSIKNGEYKCWQNNTVIVANEILMERKPYSTGGVDFGRISENMTLSEDISPEIKNHMAEAMNKRFVNEEKEVLFGIRVHMDLRNDTPVSNCPPGWYRPNDNGECEIWSSGGGAQCPPGYSGPNEKGECWRVELKCPPGWDGPDEKGQCWKLEG